MSLKSDQPISVFMVATQPENRGDLLINKCLIDEIAKYSHVLLDVKGIPEDFYEPLLENENVELLSNYTTASFKRFSMVKLLFGNIITYHYFFKSPGPMSGIYSSKSLLYLIVFIFLYAALKVRGVKTFVVGSEITATDIFSKIGYIIFGKCINHFYVRSYKNIDFLNTLRLDNVSYIPDVSFLYKKGDYSKHGGKKVLISFRDLKKHDLNKKIKKSIRNFIIFYKAKRVKIEFFFQVEFDKEFTFELYREYGDDPEITLNPECLPFVEFTTYYKDVHAVLTNRLHVALVGMLHKALPFVLVNSHVRTNKIADVFESIELDGYIHGEYSEDFFAEIEEKAKFEVNDQQKIIEKQRAICSSEIASLFR